MANKEFEGVDIKEVWNYRLSSAVPHIETGSGTWIVCIHAKDGGELLASHDTGIKTEVGDERDTAKVKECYVWLYSVRDEYALDGIEAMKAQVAKIEEANKILSELGAV